VSDVAGSAALAENLREAHETYCHLVEGIPAVLYIDANLWADRIHEADRERVERAHRESLQDGRTFRVEYRRIAADIHDDTIQVPQAGRIAIEGQGDVRMHRTARSDASSNAG